MSARLSTSLALIVVVLAGCGEAPPPEAVPRPALSAEEIAVNNEGVALMGQYRNEEARQRFAALAVARPDWLDVRVNEAIATLNRQTEGDERRALAMVEAVLAEDPDHARAAYIAGLMHFYLGDPATAMGYFSRVQMLAPNDAHVAYFSGQAESQLGRHEAALSLYRRSIELDPYLKSAYYGAALSLRQLGDGQAARAMLEDYQRFADNPRAHLAEFRYTRMGPLAEALAVGAGQGDGIAPVPAGALFEAGVDLAVLPESMFDAADRANLGVADLDDDGRLDLLLAGRTSAVWRQGNDGFILDPEHPLAGIEGLRAAAFGVPDVSGRLAAYLCIDGVNRMLQRAEVGWIEHSDPVLADAGRCRDVAALDADHDGDLDWWLANGDGPDELLSNNLDGSWRRLSEEAEPLLEGAPRGTRQLLAVDLERDGDVDLVALHDQPPHRVLVNDRLWRYREADGVAAFLAHPAVAVTSADPEATGRPQLFTLDVDGDLHRWTRGDDGVWAASLLLNGAVATPDRAGLLAQDFDGDGRPELLLHDAEGFRVLRLVEDAVEQRFAERVALRALRPLLLDADAGPALVGVVETGTGDVLRLWPAGPGRHRFLAIAPSGRADPAEGMRSNPSGIGTELLLRVGSRWSLADAYGRDSAPGQDLQPIALGLGGAERADFLRLRWTDGVLQTEMGLAAGEVHRIAEYQRQLSSCPVLFAFNGERFEFVSDVLGVGGIGFMIAPGQVAEPRPWEYFRFPDGTMQPDSGRYRLKIAEPMQEVAYIDTVALQLYDLAPGWNLVLNERMATGGPEVDGRPLFHRDDRVQVPARATNQRGEEVLGSLLAVDFVAAPVGDRDPRFLGLLAEEHVLTLEFDAVVNPPGSKPVLKAFGWVEYPYSQTVFAAWQAGERYRAPTLEARTAEGWQTVHEQFGYPAGMPREMALPLDALPPGTTALRLRSRLEIYWDWIVVVQAEAPGDALRAVHRLAPETARLARTGFARRDTLAQRRPWYDYADRAAFWDTEYPAGFYTRLGPVEPLVIQADDALALVGPGEELDLSFIAPPQPAGTRRIVVLEARGFAKDMDLYTEGAGTVGPLPSTPGVGDPPLRDRLHEEFHTRYKAGF